jgi:hypothetical protein
MRFLILRRFMTEIPFAPPFYPRVAVHEVQKKVFKLEKHLARGY